jgi:hypothetical protein
MHDIDVAVDRLTDMTWEVDGAEYRLVLRDDIPTDEVGTVGFLQELLSCNRLEAEQAYRIIMEDGEFIASARDHIGGLASEEAGRP